MNENIVAGVVKQFNELAELTEIFELENQLAVSVHKSVSVKGLIQQVVYEIVDFAVFFLPIDIDCLAPHAEHGITFTGSHETVLYERVRTTDFVACHKQKEVLVHDVLRHRCGDVVGGVKPQTAMLIKEFNSADVAEMSVRYFTFFPFRHKFG